MTEITPAVLVKDFDELKETEVEYYGGKAKRCWGALAYIIRKDAAQKLIKMPFTQHIDNVWCNKFKFCVITKTQFNHGLPGSKSVWQTPERKK